MHPREGIDQDPPTAASLSPLLTKYRNWGSRTRFWRPGRASYSRRNQPRAARTTCSRVTSTSLVGRRTQWSRRGEASGNTWQYAGAGGGLRKKPQEEMEECAAMENAFVTIRKAGGEAHTNEAELESAWRGRPTGKRRAKCSGHRSPTPPLSSPPTEAAPWTGRHHHELKVQYQEITSHRQEKTKDCPRLGIGATELGWEARGWPLTHKEGDSFGKPQHQPTPC